MKPVNPNTIAIKPGTRNNIVRLADGNTLLLPHKQSRSKYDVYHGVVISAPEYCTFRFPDTTKMVRPDDDRRPKRANKQRPERPTMASFKWKTNILPGDEIFFHHNAFENAVKNGYIEADETKRSSSWEDHRIDVMYLDPAEGISEPMVYCIIRDGTLIPLFNMCIGDLVFKEEMKTPSGIILNPWELQEPTEHLVAVEKVGPCNTTWDHDPSELQPGDIAVIKNKTKPIRFNEDWEKLCFAKDDLIAIIEQD